MKKFSSLDAPGFPYFSKIINSKQNTIKQLPNIKKQKLLSLEVKIMAQYLHYQERFTAENLCTVSDSAFTGFEKECLIYAYTSGGSVLNALKVEIRNSQDIEWRNKCPYCGISAADEIDHYLPKDLYGEYAVLSLNLIPACGKCNKKKGDYWKVENDRAIINFYLDEIPVEQFLCCDFDFKSRIPSVEYTLIQARGISDEQFKLITAHFSRLDLLIRYRDSSNDEITEVIDSILSYSVALTSHDLQKNMRDKHSKMVGRFGLNHWRCVLLAEMAVTEEFTEAMVQKTKVRLLYDGLGM